MKSIKHVWWTLIGHRKDIDLPQTRMDFKQSLDQSYIQGVVSFELWKSLFVMMWRAIPNMWLDASQNRGYFDGDTSTVTQKHMSGTKKKQKYFDGQTILYFIHHQDQNKVQLNVYMDVVSFWL